MGGASGWDKSLTPLPYAEFLLVRPFSRRQIYVSRLVLYFLVMACAPLLDLALRSQHSDLEFSLYKSKTQSTEAADKLATYQRVFPRSFVVTKEKASHPTLVIPDGNKVVAAWQLLIAVAIVLGVQSVAVLRPRALYMIGFAVFIYVPFLFPALKIDWMEALFFQFARHEKAAFLLVGAVFCCFQLFAWKKVRQMDLA